MNKLTLKDAVRTVRAIDDGIALSKNEDMLTYVRDMKNLGTEILKNLTFEEIAGALSFLQSTGIADLLDKEPVLAMALMTKQDAYTSMMVEILKFSIGITISEEWR